LENGEENLKGDSLGLNSKIEDEYEKSSIIIKKINKRVDKETDEEMVSLSNDMANDLLTNLKIIEQAKVNYIDIFKLKMYKMVNNKMFKIINKNIMDKLIEDNGLLELMKAPIIE
jgi:hypothetical protein